MNRKKLPPYMSNFVPTKCNLIFLVKQNPVLYDFSHESFHDPNANKEAWKRIGDALEKPKRWCMQKWRSLKSGYIKSKMFSWKEMVWPYSSAMAFIDKFITEVSFPPTPSFVSSEEEEGYCGDGDDNDLSSSGSVSTVSIIRAMEDLPFDEDSEPEPGQRE